MEHPTKPIEHHPITSYEMEVDFEAPTEVHDDLIEPSIVIES